MCWGRKPTGVRRLRSLIVGLPQDAVVWRPEQRERAHEWTTTEHLLALAVEKIHDVLRVNHAGVYGRSRSYRPVPHLHIPRPGEPTKSKAVSPAALARAVTGGN